LKGPGAAIALPAGEMGPRANIRKPFGLIGCGVWEALTCAFLNFGLPSMGKLKPFVVVVDDDESVSRAIKRLLRSIGIASETVASGDAFLDVLTSIPSYQPDCVIRDMQIPGLNGLEVQQRLSGGTVPFIFITAHDEINVRERALARRAVACLRKPFNDEVLVGTVWRARWHALA
jgi:FixJ family two-component response regulator